MDSLSKEEKRKTSRRVNKKQPKGMGLDQKKSSSGSSKPEKAKQASSGIKDVSEGADKTAKGATRASQGAGRVASGDVSGVKDAVGGSIDTAKGAKQMGDGAKDINQASKPDKKKNSRKRGPKDATEGGKGGDSTHATLMGGRSQNNSQRRDPYNPDNYESLFKDDDDATNSKSDDSNDSSNGDVDDKKKDKKDDKNDSSSKSDDKDDDDENSPKGMKDLLDEGDGASDDGGSEDALMDEGGDGAPDMGNIKRRATQGMAVGAAGAGAATMKAFLALIKWLKGLAAQFVAGLQSVWASIMGALSTAASWVASVTGLSALASAASVVATVAVAGATAIGGILSVSDDDGIRDDTLVCLPNTTEVSAQVMDWEDGETSVLRQENINKAWSVFSEMGVNQEVAAGILGNFSAESGVDPTGVETIYDEPYTIGPKKQAAQDAGFKVESIDAAYGNKFPGVKLVGIGLGQWSNGRNTTLTNYSKDRGLQWHDIGTQLAFMFDGDNPSDVDVLWDIANTPNISVTEATERFVREWERPAESAKNMSGRQTAAAQIYLNLEQMQVDTDYAQSIISQMNTEVAEGNHNRSSYLQDDGCGATVASHYSGAADGTGVFPDVYATSWDPAGLPSELGPFIYDPLDAGMAYGSGQGWINNQYPGQCVAFADSYMQNLYPGLTRPGGVNGSDVAEAWANKHSDQYGGELSKVPQAGAVFSHSNQGQYGHTGVVQHVFANGDIIVAEQNINGLSGDNNGTPYTWNWRYFSVEDYRDDAGYSYDWSFWKPDMEPQWTK